MRKRIMQMLKKPLIWILKSIIIFLLATLIFSLVPLDIRKILTQTFSDVYEHASYSIRQEFVDKLAEACPSENTQLTLFSQMEKINDYCTKYKSGIIGDKEFFVNFISSGIGEQQLDTPQFGFLKKYNDLIGLINTNKVLSFIILALFVTFLYLLIKDPKLFLITLGSILFSIGIFILFPYIAIKAYDMFIGIDTTSVFENEASSIISIVMLMILRTYNTFIISVAALFFAIGIASKIFYYTEKRKNPNLPRY